MRSKGIWISFIGLIVLAGLILLSSSALTETMSYKFGWVHALAINSSNGYVFAGSADAHGVWRSTDGGITWNSKSSGLSVPYVFSLAIKSNGTVYAGTDGGLIYYSTNNGDSWTATFAANGGEIRALLISGNTIYAGTMDGGVYRSVDGTTWTQINNGL